MPEWLLARLRVVGSALLLVITCAFLGVTLQPSYWLLTWAYERFGPAVAVGLVPVGYMLWGVCYALSVIALKWLSWSRFKPGSYPFFSMTVVRWAFINMMAEVCNQMFIRWVIGTDFIVYWFRLLGAKIGKRVTINTVIFSDWDLMEIGDDVFIGGRATVIGHVGEMGKLKFKATRIGNRCTIGQEASVFPGVVMEDDSVLGAQSLATKDMVITGNSIWGGLPAKFIKARTKGEQGAVDVVTVRPPPPAAKRA